MQRLGCCHCRARSHAAVLHSQRPSFALCLTRHPKEEYLRTLPRNRDPQIETTTGSNVLLLNGLGKLEFTRKLPVLPMRCSPMLQGPKRRTLSFDLTSGTWRSRPRLSNECPGSAQRERAFRAASAASCTMSLRQRAESFGLETTFTGGMWS